MRRALSAKCSPRTRSPLPPATDACGSDAPSVRLKSSTPSTRGAAALVCGATIDSVRYGDLGEAEFDVTPSCDVLEAHTKIVCTTLAGAGGTAISWVVTIDGQASVAPLSTRISA